MRTSLTGITSESRTYSGDLVDQTEFVSIAGLLGTPAPGMIYHMIEKSEQESLLGISYDTKSFVLIGESAPAGRNFAAEVSELKSWLEEVDQIHTLMVENQTDQMALERKLVLLASETDAQGKPLPKLDAATGEWMRNQVKHAITSRKSEFKQLDERLVCLEKKIREASAKPGIIIARWQSDDRNRIGISAAPTARASVDWNSQGEGYVVLGGVRILVPFFSMDASTMFLDIEEASPGSLKSLKYAAITTYMLQAKEIAYTTSSSSASTVSAAAAINRSQLASWASLLADFQKISLDASIARSQQNVSGGRIGQFKWKRLDLDYSHRWNEWPHQHSATDARARREKAQRDLLQLAGVEEIGTSSETDDWTTVIVQVMTPTKLTRLLAGAFVSVTGVLDEPGNVDKLERKLRGKRPPSLVREQPKPDVEINRLSPGQ